MNLLVNSLGIVFIVWVVWYFWLWKGESVQATNQSGVQEIDITVQGGYRPAEIVVQVGQRVRLNFTRRESSACSEEIVLPDFGLRSHLPQNQTVTLEVTPGQPGEYEFVCGMNMLKGKLIAR
ncbi:cupredoxin domain-containing protein [Candidatus Cyanaurora vandensis]|uniref:cupredoxin domain-containing protein n=1 Tax=Candidatus Cyanaurora vandensis TaxID=2714958 RepID=UPI00257C08E1|nr:cupredoxin domain-containing protein [Candidatus Cyanaurora vandensis]